MWINRTRALILPDVLSCRHPCILVCWWWPSSCLGVGVVLDNLLTPLVGWPVKSEIVQILFLSFNKKNFFACAKMGTVIFKSELTTHSFCACLMRSKRAYKSLYKLHHIIAQRTDNKCPKLIHAWILPSRNITCCEKFASSLFLCNIVRIAT